MAVCLYGGEDQRAVLLDRVEDEQLADGRADGHDAHVREDRWVGAEEGDDGHNLERDEQACVRGARDPVGRGLGRGAAGWKGLGAAPGGVGRCGSAPSDVKPVENMLAYIIIVIELTPWLLNTLDCQFDVNESHTMYVMMKAMPTTCVSRSGASFTSYNLKMAAPEVTAIAMRYSIGVYLRSAITTDHRSPRSNLRARSPRAACAWPRHCVLRPRYCSHGCACYSDQCHVDGTTTTRPRHVDMLFGLGGSVSDARETPWRV